MQKPKSPTPAFLLMTLLALTGLGLFLWHLAIHPDPQLIDPGSLPPLRTQGIAPFVAVASRHHDGAAVPFTVVVHQRDRANLRRHLDRIAINRGWYPHRAGEEQSLVVPEGDLQLLYDMERDPVDWVRSHGDSLAMSAPMTDAAKLVNVTVRVKGRLLSGALRVLAIAVWVLAAFAGLHFLGRLGCESEPPEDASTDT